MGRRVDDSIGDKGGIFMNVSAKVRYPFITTNYYYTRPKYIPHYWPSLPPTWLPHVISFFSFTTPLLFFFLFFLFFIFPFLTSFCPKPKRPIAALQVDMSLWRWLFIHIWIVNDDRSTNQNDLSFVPTFLLCRIKFGLICDYKTKYVLLCSIYSLLN